MRLANKTVIVTGASSGIGRAIAVLFASEGAMVVCADITTEVVEGGPPVCEVIEKSGGKAIFRRTDVASEADVESLVAETAERHGRLDVIVNDAVVRGGAPLMDTTSADWDRVMAVNLKGVYLCCRSAIRQMLRQEVVNEARGRIVNISSQHGMIAAPQDFAYGVSKAGVVYMTRQIAADYGKDHIICNAVAPGKIVTGKGGRAASPEAMAYSAARTPMPRLGRPRDVANAALFLASDECTYVTGHNLLVDGGWMAA